MLKSLASGLQSSVNFEPFYKFLSFYLDLKDDSIMKIKSLRQEMSEMD